MRTIEEALAECRAAWAMHPKAKYGWCIHHNVEMERLYKPIENRIRLILAHKPKKRRVVHLDNLRPVVSEKAVKAQKRYLAKVTEARKRYFASCAPARKRYLAECVPAWKPYFAKCASARKRYLADCAPARRRYNAKCAPAWKRFYTDIAKERKLFVQALASIHRVEVPSHTWNGASIFAEDKS